MKRYLIIIIVILTGLRLSAQDPEFTQFYANPLYLNPAFAGTAKGARYVANYRNQWFGLSNPFVTYSFSYDEHFDALGGGIGVRMMYDLAGEGNLGTTVGGLIYSYHLNLTPKFTIKASLEAAIQQKTIDFSKLVFGDMIDARHGVVRQTIEELPSPGFYKTDPYPDFSAGFLGFTKKFYAGLVINHINEPKNTFLDDSKVRLPMKLTTHLGMQIPLENTRFPTKFFSPNILIQKQADFLQFNLGAYYIKDKFIVGAWWRQTSANTDALMALVGFKKDMLKIGYSYDITFTDVRYGGIGSHELSIIVEIEKRTRLQTATKWRKLDCPDF